MSERFVPIYPPREPGPVAVWRGFVGERARTSVFGWSERAFRDWNIERVVFGYRVHIPLHPDAVQRVLLDNAANYVKPGLVKRLLMPTIGRGLLSSDGELWRDQRRIVAASFTPPAVDELMPLFWAVANDATGGWEPGVRDMSAAATAATMEVISRALFSGDRRLTTDRATAHITAALEGVSERRLQVLLGLPMVPMSPRGWRARKGQIYLRETLGELVRERAEGDPDGDFLSRLIHALHARFPSGEATELAIDNAATFYLAGHETTANTIAWTLYLLSERPELQEDVAAEAAAALAGGIDSELPDRLPLLRRVIEESLRLYPAAPRFDREAVADDRLCEIEVRAGDLVSVWPWLLHRHTRLWDDPDAFDPDRFLPEAKAARHRFQYIPFGGGPRTCVGARFATVEAMAILSAWLAKWRFSPIPGREVRVSGAVTLRPAGGLPLRLTAR